MEEVGLCIYNDSHVLKMGAEYTKLLSRLHLDLPSARLCLSGTIRVCCDALPMQLGVLLHAERLRDLSGEQLHSVSLYTLGQRNY